MTDSAGVPFCSSCGADMPSSGVCPTCSPARATQVATVRPWWQHTGVRTTAWVFGSLFVLGAAVLVVVLVMACTVALVLAATAVHLVRSWQARRPRHAARSLLFDSWPGLVLLASAIGFLAGTAYLIAR